MLLAHEASFRWCYYLCQLVKPTELVIVAHTSKTMHCSFWILVKKESPPPHGASETAPITDAVLRHQIKLRFHCAYTHAPSRELNLYLNSNCFLSLLDILDVQGMVYPEAKVKAGLNTTGEGQVELEAVHVRASIIDLAAEVIIMLENFVWS